MTQAPDAGLRRLAGYCLKRATAAAEARASDALRGFGLRRTTFSALSVIAESPGLSQAQLADALAIERPNIVPIVGELEAARLVSRVRSADDRRAYRLQATPAGRRLCSDAFARLEDRDRSLTEGLSTAERQALLRILGQVEANAAAMAEVPPPAASTTQRELSR